MERNGAFYSTYGWHPRSVKVAITTLRYIKRHRSRLLADVARTSDYFVERLRSMRFARDAKLRVLGLAIGIDFGDEGYCEKIGERCREAGLLVSPEGATVLLIPALNIDRATARRGLDRFEKVVSSGG
jgi:acetylornithine/succinyldiaminopimelate/putrescine aminotransferase